MKVYLIFWFQSILKHDKTNYNALVFVGVAADGLEQEEQALMAFRKATQVDPQQQLAWQVGIMHGITVRCSLLFFCARITNTYTGIWWYRVSYINSFGPTDAIRRIIFLLLSVEHCHTTCYVRLVRVPTTTYGGKKFPAFYVEWCHVEWI